MARYSTFTKPVVEPIADGQYPAIIYQIIDLGSQKFSKNGSEWFSPQRLIGFELPGMTFETKNGETLSKVISITAFDSLNPSKNGQIGQREVIDAAAQAQGWDEEQLAAYDIDQLLGKSVMLTVSGVESNGKVYQNITAIETLPGGMIVEPIRENVSISVGDFVSLNNLDIPDWIKNKIASSKEYQDHIALENARTGADVNQVAMDGEVSSLANDHEIRIEDVPF